MSKALKQRINNIIEKVRPIIGGTLTFSSIATFQLEMWCEHMESTYQLAKAIEETKEVRAKLMGVINE